MDNQPKKTIYPSGMVTWTLNGKLHRKNGPAVEIVNGDKEWYLNGLKHREDGPAIEYISGYRAWYLHGNLIKCVRGVS